MKSDPIFLNVKSLSLKKSGMLFQMHIPRQIEKSLQLFKYRVFPEIVRGFYVIVSCPKIIYCLLEGFKKVNYKCSYFTFHSYLL